MRIIYGKTASLFESTAFSAAISVGASEEVIRAMGDYAVQLGLAFQIKDDIFDYSDEAKALGKPVGIDLKEQKITQPLLCALETAPIEEQKRIRGLVARIADEPSLAEEVSAFVKEHDGVALAVAEMEKHVNLAISYLQVLPESKEKGYLERMARYVAQREK